MIPFGPMAQKSTNTYCMHKIGIMIQVFNYFNYKMMQMSWVDSFKTNHVGWIFIHNYATCDGPINGVGRIFQGQNNCLIYKKSYGYCLITPNVVNSQGHKMHICMNMQYVLHGHQ
jgi:hypothetical protein